jgi:hypothetical protein
LRSRQKRKNGGHAAPNYGRQGNLISAVHVYRHMRKNLSEFLREAADSLRDLALRAPDIAGELRRFADDLEEQAQRATRDDRPWGKHDAAD